MYGEDPWKIDIAWKRQTTKKKFDGKGKKKEIVKMNASLL